MRFLDAKKGDSPDSITEQDVQNKMLAGTREDQRPRARTPNNVLRLAADLNIDIAHVEGTGENGQITEEDVRDAEGDPAKRLPDAPVLTDTRVGRGNRAERGDTRPTNARTTPTNAPTGGAPTPPANPPKPTA